MVWQPLLRSSFPAKEVAEITKVTSTKLLVSVDSPDGTAGDYGYLVPTFFDPDIGAFEGVWKKVFWGKFQQISIDSLGEQQFGLLFFPSRIKADYSLSIYEYQKSPKHFVKTILEPTLLLESNFARTSVYIANFGPAIRISGNSSFSGSQIEELVKPGYVWFDDSSYKGEIWGTNLSSDAAIEIWEN